MKSPTINRGKFATFYQNAGFFSLMISKAQQKSEFNILSFPVGEYSFTSVIVSRKEAANVLRKFKKEIDNARNKA